MQRTLIGSFLRGKLKQIFNEFDLIFNISFFNPFNLSPYFAKRMLSDRPSTAYSASKGAVESFTKALAFELGPLGIRINAIAPGTVFTPQVAYDHDRLDDAAKYRFDAMVRSIYPLQRIGEGGGGG